MKLTVRRLGNGIFAVAHAVAPHGSAAWAKSPPMPALVFRPWQAILPTVRVIHPIEFIYNLTHPASY